MEPLYANVADVITPAISRSHVGENRVISRRSELAVSYGPLITPEWSLLSDFPFRSSGNVIWTTRMRAYFGEWSNKNPHKKINF